VYYFNGIAISKNEIKLLMPKTALVVEDDSAVRRFVAALLRTEGFQVLEANDGAEALALLGEPGRTIQIIVSDIQMAMVDGVSLYEKAAVQFGNVPFVFITGHAESERVVSVPSGSPILTKPFLPQDLLACVHHVLCKKPSEAERN
jgi:two-component system cell cycle sensor histidine kinase/response regulator CckA